MNKKYIYITLALLLVISSSCNEVYTDEQYEQYVSFKAPTSHVAQIRLKYREGEFSPYRLPLIVAGSTINNKDLYVHVGIDNDTLEIFNHEHYYDRKDLYYKQLPEEYYSIPSYDVHVPAGECQALMDINFNFKGLDLSEKWVLPLIIKDDPDYNYISHPRKNYNNALLYITPFNDYSGTYQTTTLNVYPDGSNSPLVVNNREAYVVDEKTVFFYAGVIKENRPDRRKFKIYATFNPETEDRMQGSIELRAENDEINFLLNNSVTYEISDVMDVARPNFIKRTVSIRGLNYTFQDPWETMGYTTKYNVRGTMTMQRNINTLIDDEEFQIEW